MGTGSAMAPSADTSAINSNATAMSSGATVTNTTVTNGPVPDTPENRAKYGSPMSHAGKRPSPPVTEPPNSVCGRPLNVGGACASPTFHQE